MRFHVRMCAAIILFGLFVSGVGVFSAEEAKSRESSDRTTVAKIDEAIRAGHIDTETAILYTVYAVKDYDRLPDRFRSEKPMRCGTLSLLRARRNMAGFSTGVRGELESYMARPGLSGPETVITTDHFKIHYTTSGGDGVTADYAQDIADYAEQSWTREIDEMGWETPPVDGIDGDEYDMYILNGGAQGWVGYTQPEGSGPDPDQDEYKSYIVIAKDLSDGLAKVTVAHEFNHACQFSYSGEEADFWYENCAVWMEDMVYDRVNDYYSYISEYWENPISQPRLPITTSDGEYEYGAAPWVFYLTERHDDNDIPRQIWERNGVVSGNETIEDIDYVLSTGYGSSFNQALKEYSVWRYFSGSNHDGDHFSESRNWVDPHLSSSHIHNSYPVQGNEATVDPDHYGANFIRFNPPGGGMETLNIAFNGQDGREWGAMVLFYPGTEVVEIGLDGSGAGAVNVDWNECERICLVPVVLSSSGWNLTYTYSANQGADETPPTMEPIVEPQDQWYAVAPSFSTFGFTDNVNLDDGWYQINSCSGPWLAIFTDAAGMSWDDDGWTVPGFEGLPQGSNTIYFKVDDDADFVGGGCSWSWRFRKDTVPPDVPSGLRSTSHETGVWSSDPTIDVSWTASVDPYPGSGPEGYSSDWNTFVADLPDYSADIEKTVTDLTSPELDDGDSHYFHIRAVDEAGNWQNSIHIGPFLIDGTSPVEGTLSIERGADTTETAIVTIDSIHAADEASGMGQGAVMRLSNDGQTWSEPEPYAPVRTGWDLTDGVCGGSHSDGQKTVSIQFRDVAGNWSKTFQDVIIYHPTLTLLAGDLPDGYVGFAYSETLLVVGGTPPYLWRLVSGALPAGCVLDSLTGVIGGIPETAETANFTIDVADAACTVTGDSLSITVHLSSAGDVNADGEINVLDALFAVNIILGILQPNAYQTWAADCNGDDMVNIIDVLGIVNASLGIGSCPPTGR